MAKTFSPKEMLELPMLDNDAGAATFRDYFKAFLDNAINLRSFDHDRPFGELNWRNELYDSLIWNQVADFNVINGLTPAEQAHLDTFIGAMVKEL